LLLNMQKIEFINKSWNESEHSRDKALSGNTSMKKSYVAGMAHDMKHRAGKHGAYKEEMETHTQEKGKSMMQARKAKKKKRQAKLYQSVIAICAKNLRNSKDDTSVSMAHIAKLIGLKAEAEKRLRTL